MLIISESTIDIHNRCFFLNSKLFFLSAFFAKFLLCFSIITNFPKAITTKRPENNLSCLHGIRALTLFYVILLHQYYANVKYYITSKVHNVLIFYVTDYFLSRDFLKNYFFPNKYNDTFWNFRKSVFAKGEI